MSLGVADRAEYHVMSHPQTFPRGLAPDYRGVAVGTTLGRKSKNLFTPQVSLTPCRPLHKATAVFGHAGGRLVVPNTGAGKFNSIPFLCVNWNTLNINLEISAVDFFLQLSALWNNHKRWSRASCIAFWSCLTLSVLGDRWHFHIFAADQVTWTWIYYFLKWWG